MLRGFSHFLPVALLLSLALGSDEVREEYRCSSPKVVPMTLVIKCADNYYCLFFE